MEDPELREALKAGEKADFAMAAIGSVVADHSTVVEAGYLSVEELGELAAAGAVGDVCSRHLNSQDRECRVDLSERVIGLNLEQLRAIPRVVGVADGLGNHRRFWVRCEASWWAYWVRTMPPPSPS